MVRPAARFLAPTLRMHSSLVTIETELKRDSKGVIHTLDGFSSGIALWIDGSRIQYEYNLYEIERTRVPARRVHHDSGLLGRSHTPKIVPEDQWFAPPAKPSAPTPSPDS